MTLHITQQDITRTIAIMIHLKATLVTHKLLSHIVLKGVLYPEALCACDWRLRLCGLMHSHAQLLGLVLQMLVKLKMWPQIQSPCGCLGQTTLHHLTVKLGNQNIIIIALTKCPGHFPVTIILQIMTFHMVSPEMTVGSFALTFLAVALQPSVYLCLGVISLLGDTY